VTEAAASPESADALALAEKSFSAGDFLHAFEIATAACRAGDRTLRLRQIEVMAAARLGNAAAAVQLYNERGLGDESDVDSLALRARLDKDEAFEDRTPSPEALDKAAQGYLAVYRRTGSPFPGINAATLFALAGDAATAAALAQQILAKPDIDSPKDYFAAATRAEALLLLGKADQAVDAARNAILQPGANAGARASTIMQMQRLRSLVPEAAEVAKLLRPPRVAHFCGHIFDHDDQREAELAAHIDSALKEWGVGYAYGALAAGFDILFAERLIARGGELHLVLPFDEAQFLEESVAVAGGDWKTRYDAVRGQVASVAFATRSDYVGDPGQFAYGSDVAMGMARLRAAHLGTEAVQIAGWDGSAIGVAGTGRDVARWRSAGGDTMLVAAADLSRPSRSPATASDRRELKALLFADFPGFSALPERFLPVFWSEVMQTAWEALKQQAARLDYKNTWGDAIFAVFDNAEAAAAAALDMQERLSRLDPSRLGLDRPPTMRVSLHYGPVFFGRDAVTGSDSYYGVEVSRAARVEPATPPGSVYVTEPFAAILEMDGGQHFRTNFVGTLQLPKGYGAFRIYHLTRNGR
jgi:class 3 adenylate cyclase